MATVIKGTQCGPMLRRLSTVDLADHLAEAKAIIEEAKRCAARIKSSVDAEAGQKFAAARESGYEAGFREGHEEGKQAGYKRALDEATQQFQQQQAHLAETLSGLISEITKTKEDLRLTAERDLLEFAVQLATKLTFAVGRLSSDSAIENLKRALGHVGSWTDLTVCVHPDDLQAIETFTKSLGELLRASAAVGVTADGTMARGGCRLRTGRGEIDATLETQLSEMVAMLLPGGSPVVAPAP